jgi:DNA repair exonuclease SbcCD nuclease subunit
MALPQVHFLHSSDWRLETPLGGVPEVPAELREAFLEAPYQAAERVVQAAIDQRVDFLILSGNILSIELASPYTFEFLMRQWQRLAEHQIAVYWLGGTHDDLDLWPAALTLPSHVHVFGSSAIQRFEHLREGRVVARIAGQSDPQGAGWRAADYAASDDTVARIAVAFGETATRSLENKGIDYWALGGRDQHQLVIQGKQAASWCGGPQGRTPADLGPHGAVLVQWEYGRCETQLIETDVFRWSRQSIDATHLQSVDELQGQLQRSIQLTPMTPNESSRFQTLIECSVVCRGELMRQLYDPLVDERLRRGLQPNSPNASHWILSIDPEPAELPGELWEEDTILGDFLRTVRRLGQDGEAWRELLTYVPDSSVRERLAAGLTHEFVEGSDAARQRFWRDVAVWGSEMLRGESTSLTG